VTRLRFPGGDLHCAGEEDAEDGDLVPQWHVELENQGEWDTEDEDIAGHVGDGGGLVHVDDVGVAASHLIWLRSPIVRDGVALEESGEEDGDEPEADVDGDADDGDLEASVGEDAPVEGEDGGLDDWHGGEVEKLKGKHDLLDQ
jgi:hypothetical protein